MRRHFLAALAALSLAACTDAEEFSHQPIPAEYQHSAQAKIVFLPFGLVETSCVALGAAPPPKGQVILACASRERNLIIMPEPCGVGESYSEILCHEKAHINGWSHD